MPRRLRLQYPDAIYHLMARGNGRQDIVCDDFDRDRLQEHLGRAAIRYSWRVYAFAIMSHHRHVVLKTPEPHLAAGMQAFLSGYAHGWSRRHRFSGSEVVCAAYEVDRAELRRRGSRHPARAALAYLARRRTAATNAELAAVLAVSRAKSVPNLTRRFAAWVAIDARVRERLRA